MEIVVGTKKWSSWSLRPWLAIKHTGQPFDETLVELRHAERSTAEILKHSPSGMVPALKDGDLVLWDSLAICEYLNERYPDAKLWPHDPTLRALGRAAASEMHSGFASLRGECPMKLDTRVTVDISEATQKDVRRIVALWGELLAKSGGPFLLGPWSIADAYYTPVATRFRSYGIHPSDYGDTGPAGEYCQRLLQAPEYLEWEKAALA
ncbi:MAG: Glutathione S-transferase domain [Caulobacter sp.]|nr:Glutathione S-transferase domain [Caulobacter sp.]